MEESQKYIKESVEGLKKAYAEYIRLNEFSEIEKENFNSGSYISLKERLIEMSAVKLNYHASILEFMMSQHLSIEINTLKKELIKQTETSRKSAIQQRRLTGAIIFIGLSSLIITICQMLSIKINW